MEAEQGHLNKLPHDHTHILTISCYRQQTFFYDSVTCRRFQGFQPYLKAVCNIRNVEMVTDRDGNVYRTVKLL
jgi:REP element-mobilizing transposase RayT